ncbi:hypothetical protein Vadar_012577 [Vaccinium darrowii]|uniref:Uncharacterized protein n=1 Tax=Vaccinium darrowii TaxID=229202 RepID=A0ACB7YMC6_9ERIC|nr:hypothetical protein Vadar_012577 [Vaccinium darrowii]
MEPDQELTTVFHISDPPTTTTTSRRRFCSGGCDRPINVCLCDKIPTEPISTFTQVVILHHPHEQRHKLATVPVLSKCLRNFQTLIGRGLRLGHSPLLDSLYNAAVENPSQPFRALYLFPGVIRLHCRGEGSTYRSWHNHEKVRTHWLGKGCSFRERVPGLAKSAQLSKGRLVRQGALRSTRAPVRQGTSSWAKSTGFGTERPVRQGAPGSTRVPVRQRASGSALSVRFGTERPVRQRAFGLANGVWFGLANEPAQRPVDSSAQRLAN